ncbi:SDR family NAD(P)-dependent oxidoreductase [Sphingomonas koreensis]|jgi:NAD(P)-dependent dehydrogenase (short-subunit alcohol dehydrogenase family)|uniref:3-oxoacyl-[acyl-carrier-protein] reductase n=1 Tax=Sphingomonas koreensis TaxID=93064 RepID=A0A1L6J580_9SPHN|nr:SDR family NAD(P)-dependent oxidoreductase [Sphingomonas koreensis]APR51111.1 3-oxoacyl-[acyl-carrier-protein] reductase [Sphingomonas koreensis]MDC7810596.1 SDR family NAD(P)-dependent oxidoreductase [Sphingomonas koreensis]RSU17717.1 SDR family NAD(P)-dependent oxidoreductase [Sphingomonas koreensis]RSU21963.1 SDR family NAD(P)-dependent oxidoreductase [Sphingomonas koreensis]RSU23107.1 SDR family NAD(P)-dependent oxidoreductase [Sphingomonas koreensis]
MGHVIVTGGLGGLGRAVVTTLKSRGHRVVAVDIASGESDADCVIAGVDLADETAVATAFSEAAGALGEIDALVNVAGGFTWEPVETGSMESWDAMYRINLRTAAISSRAVLPHLKSGAIVNVGAAASAAPGMGMAPYAASKAGVMALTESLAEELRGRGIRVNAILPTILDTPANRKDMPDADPAGWVSLESAAAVVAFLLSQDAAAITGTGIKLSLGTAGA